MATDTTIHRPALAGLTEVRCWTPCHDMAVRVEYEDFEGDPSLPVLVECGRCHAYWLVRFVKSWSGVKVEAVWSDPGI